MAGMPSPLSESTAHAAAADAVADFFASAAIVDAVLLVGSWARGHADKASDLDLAVLIRPEVDEADRHELAANWERSAQREQAASLLRPVARYSDVEIELIDGDFAPRPRGWTSGPDDFELRLGNYVAHSLPLFQSGTRYAALREHWLPFYDDALRTQRLESVRIFCLNNLDHVPWALERSDPFHAYHRLYHAYQEFLQALFISRRTYPIAYDKWIGQQLEQLLELPELALETAGIIGIADLDPPMIRERATRLDSLLDQYVSCSLV